MFHEESIGLAERALKLAEARGADEVAVHVQSVTARQVRFSNNNVDVVKSWIQVGLEMQIVKDRRVVVVSTTNITEEGLERFIEGAMERISRLPPREVYAPLPEGPFDYPVIPGLYDPRVESDQEALVEAATRGIEAALSEGAKRVAGAVRSYAGHECLLTTGGAEVCERFSKVNMEVRALVDDLATGHGVTCSRSLDGIDPERAGREAGADAAASTNVVDAEPGKYDAVFGWSAMATLMGVFGYMASGLRVLMQMSPYVDKLGEQIGSELITLIDDPLAEGGYASRSFDLEGYPTMRNTIIEKGVLKTFLHNRLTAAYFRTKSTANAGWVDPAPWYIRMEPGDYGEDEIVAELRDGILVKNVTYLRFQNYRTGDFSAVIRDGVFRVKGGEVVGAVRGLRLSDSVPHLLRDAFAISQTTRPVTHWWAEWGPPVETPMLAVRQVGFTAATV